MENEIFEEVYIEDSDEVVNSDQLDNSIEEVESTDTYSQDELISALLSLMNDKAAEDSEEEFEEETFENSSPEPVLVQSVDESIDYSSQLDSIIDELIGINSHIDNVVSVITPHDLFTPLNDYTLTETFLLFGVLLGLFGFSASFISNHVFHLRR